MAGREGASGLGMAQGRISAVQTCADRGYKPGDKLRSAAWSSDLQVMVIGSKFVTVRRLSESRTDRVRSFPGDVEASNGG